MEAFFPLTSRAPETIVFWRGADAIRCTEMLRHVAAVAAQLPDRNYVINLCNDRYNFLVGFLAALVRNQVSLLTSDRTTHGTIEIASRYPGTYALIDQAIAPIGIESFDLSGVERAAAAADGAVMSSPRVQADRVAAIVFTSGSTGTPVGHPKPWGALAQCTLEAAKRFGFDRAAPVSIIGTVPPQHMYGFETTVLMPLHASAAGYAGPTFYPQDVALSLSHVSQPRMLVTTPLQLRALLRAGLALGPVEKVISATAPLAPETAAEAERAWNTEVHEIYGATEVGSIASRRTVGGDVWRAYGSVAIECAAGETLVSVAHGTHPVPLSDEIEVLDPGHFRLIGRKTDIVKLAGKRASLAGLNKILNDVVGVRDGVFVVADESDRIPTARLTAFVVAPDCTPDDIMAALRQRLEAPFLPRRIVKVDHLPRNPVGKLPAAALTELQQRLVKS